MSVSTNEMSCRLLRRQKGPWAQCVRGVCVPGGRPVCAWGVCVPGGRPAVRLCCSGAGAPHRLWAARGPGGESLLVSGDLAHGLLDLPRCGPLPVDLHIQAEGYASRRRRRQRRPGARLTHAHAHTHTHGAHRQTIPPSGSVCLFSLLFLFFNTRVP